LPQETTGKLVKPVSAALVSGGTSGTGGRGDWTELVLLFTLLFTTALALWHDRR